MPQNTSIEQPQTAVISTSLNPDVAKSSSPQPIECRICLDQSSPLIAPCKCTGTVRYVHEECLMHWAQERLRKALSRMEEERDYQGWGFIDCELCKERVRVGIEWFRVRRSLSQARKRDGQCFWVTLIINILIGLLCLGCICFSLAILVLVLTSSPFIDYSRFKSTPFATWTILAATFVIGLVFFIRSVKQIISIFCRKQPRLTGIVYKQVVNKDGKELIVNDGYLVEKQRDGKRAREQLDVSHQRMMNSHESSNTNLVVVVGEVRQESKATHISSATH